MIETVYNDDKSILIKCKIDENRIYITASPTELYPETVFKTASWFRGQHMLLEIVASLNTILTIDTFYSRRILCHLVRKIPNHTLVQLEAFGGHPAHKKIYECESVSKSPDAMRDELRNLNFPPNPKTKRFKFWAIDGIYNLKNSTSRAHILAYCRGK
jgi:hypothetical protein